eukprot:3909298-Pyramimonas_sp.AAC.1
MGSVFQQVLFERWRLHWGGGCRAASSCEVRESHGQEGGKGVACTALWDIHKFDESIRIDILQRWRGDIGPPAPISRRC